MRWSLSSLGFALLFPASVWSQGRTDYFNVESPQVKPITVARIAGYDYLLVCNTPDNALEIWNTDENAPPDERLLASVPVGLEPVSVRYSEELGSCYTANFLGDSVSDVEISAPDGPHSLQARLRRSTWVLDEPMDISFHEVEWADPDGAIEPTDVALLGLRPNVAYEKVPLMSQLWSNETFNNNPRKNGVGSLFVHTLRLFQWGLIQDGQSEGGFGLPEVRHDAPRRFRVAGWDIRHRARLHLHVPMGVNGPPRKDLSPGHEEQVLTWKIERGFARALSSGRARDELGSSRRLLLRWQQHVRRAAAAHPDLLELAAPVDAT